MKSMFSLPQLSYSYTDLEPHIDAKTMEIHHTKHHQAYVDKLNKALEGSETKSIEDILKNINNVDEKIRQAVINNGGGHYNHTLFWDILTPGGSKEPFGEVKNLIDSTFGSFDDFKLKFNEQALARFGSGWCWLVKSDSGLEIYTTPNQESPLMESKLPILGVDVWEHAYYLKYQNRRNEYLEAIWNVINWDKVNERYV